MVTMQVGSFILSHITLLCLFCSCSSAWRHNDVISIFLLLSCFNEALVMSKWCFLPER
jgi:hypothetical protein